MFYSFANTFARDQEFLKLTHMTPTEQLTQSNMVVFEVTFWPMTFVPIDSSLFDGSTSLLKSLSSSAKVALPDATIRSAEWRRRFYRIC